MRIVDLFSGCGGMSLGFMKAGFDVVAALDNWKPAIRTYQRNFNHPILERDLTEHVTCAIEIASFKPEMIIGGPPCQDFSSAGKRDETMGRANLTVAFAKIIDRVRPQWFVMENVPRAADSRAYQNARTIFKKAGYGLTEEILDACYCGVPQSRKRFFVIGHHKGDDEELLGILHSKLSKKPLSVREYFGDTLKINHYYRHPRSYLRRAIFSVDEPSPTIRGVNRPIPDGYPGHTGDTAPIDESLRPLTTQERSLIQTFPKSFVFEGTKAEVEQAIGNAVPVKLAQFVASAIRDFIQNPDNHRKSSVYYSKFPLFAHIEDNCANGVE